MTLTLTLYRVILHTVMQHSSTSTKIPNFVEMEETFLWTDGRTDGWTVGHLRPALLGRLGGVDLITSAASLPYTCYVQLQYYVKNWLDLCVQKYCY